VQPVALPPFPLTVGSETPGAGSMVTGVLGEVPAVDTVQLPT